MTQLADWSADTGRVVLLDAGSATIGGSVNARFDGPAGLPLTLFEGTEQ